MSILRTPDNRFENLAAYPFQAHYAEIQDQELGSLRIHFVDEGPRDGPVILCLHGEPTWSYLNRKMIPVFSTAGFRVLAPDLVGKPFLKLVPGTRNQPHITLSGGHFIQEEDGETWARAVLEWLESEN